MKSPARILISFISGICVFSPVLVGVVSLNFTGWWFYSISLILGILAIVVMLLMLRLLQPESGPKWMVNLVLVSVSSGVFITLLDILIRVALPGMVYYRPNERYLSRWPAMPLLQRYQPNVSVEQDSYGDLAAFSGEISLREERRVSLVTDAYGFTSQGESPNHVDILVLGDSFGMGLGTSIEKTWPTILSQDTGLSVTNLSVTSEGPWHEMMNYQIEHDRLNIDSNTRIIWLLFGGNDLIDDYYDQYSVDDLKWDYGIDQIGTRWETFANRSPIGMTTGLLLGSATDQRGVIIKEVDHQQIAFLGTYVDVADFTADFFTNMEQYPDLDRVFAVMGEQTRRDGASVTVVNVPSKGEVYYWIARDLTPWTRPPMPSGFAQVIAPLAEREGMCFIDLGPLLMDEAQERFEASGEFIYWRDDTHWNVEGHRIVADILATHPCLGIEQ